MIKNSLKFTSENLQTSVSPFNKNLSVSLPFISTIHISFSAELSLGTLTKMIFIHQKN
jgi:hypothetical protein